MQMLDPIQQIFASHRSYALWSSCYNILCANVNLFQQRGEAIAVGMEVSTPVHMFCTGCIRPRELAMAREVKERFATPLTLFGDFGNVPKLKYC